MSIHTPAIETITRWPRARQVSTASNRARVLSDPRRALQCVLGVIWLLDGALQFQAVMYGGGLISTLRASAAGQPLWVADTVSWAAGVMHWQQASLNTGAALVQVAIGLGLIHRPTVRPALLLSFAWALSVWWFGEGFGMLLTASASPLTGAPGAALLYVLIGLIVWPSDLPAVRPLGMRQLVGRSPERTAERPGGLLGQRGARMAWAALWMVAAWEWLQSSGANPNAISRLLASAPSGVGWLSHLQHWCARAVAGNGVMIGLLLAFASGAIAIAVLRDWHAHAFLRLSIGLSLLFWVVGQGFGGILAGGATDPNTGPLLVLLAFALQMTVVDPSGTAVGVSGCDLNGSQAALGSREPIPADANRALSGHRRWGALR